MFRVASSYVGGGSSGVGFKDKFVISGKFRGGAEAEFTPWIEVWEDIGGAVGIVHPWFKFVSVCAWPASSEYVGRPDGTTQAPEIQVWEWNLHESS